MIIWHSYSAPLLLAVIALVLAPLPTVIPAAFAFVASAAAVAVSGTAALSGADGRLV